MVARPPLLTMVGIAPEGKPLLTQTMLKCSVQNFWDRELMVDYILYNILFDKLVNYYGIGYY